MTMATDSPKLPRIVIYGVGQYGKRVAGIAAAKGFPIAAAVNRAGDKVGRDLGRVAGLDTDLGVIIQDCDTADYAAMDADIGIVTMTDYLDVNYPAYERLMNAGMNVACIATQASLPQAVNAELAGRIEELAMRNGVTFTGTSVWDMTRVWAGILVAAPCTEIRGMRMTSVTNVGYAGLHALKYVGVGQTQEEFAAHMEAGLGPLGGFYSLPAQQVLQHLGYHVTDVNEYNEPVLFDEPIECPPLERVLEPGVCVGSRIVSKVSTEEGIVADTHVELRLTRPGEREHTAWAVEGRPPCTISIDRRDSVHHTAAALFNRIPDVIAAPSGIQPVSHLGVMKPSALQ
jgi:4-hydroxy-tetrahydrodipicolinate reductase